jgi:hypothetical protein
MQNTSLTEKIVNKGLLKKIKYTDSKQVKVMNRSDLKLNETGVQYDVPAVDCSFSINVEEISCKKHLLVLDGQYYSILKFARSY